MRKSQSKWVTLTGLLAVAIIALGVWVAYRGYSDRSPKLVNLISVIEAKTYVYSILPPMAIEERISQGMTPETPAMFPLYKDGDDLFVDPENMKELVHIMAGEIRIFPREEKSHQGYLSRAGENAYSMNSKTGSAEKIGEYIVSSEVLLRKGDEEKRIRWEVRSKSAEWKAIENCEMRSFWYMVQPSPGTTVLDTHNKLVVPMTALEAFYNTTVVFDSENHLLTVQTRSPPNSQEN